MNRNQLDYAQKSERTTSVLKYARIALWISYVYNNTSIRNDEGKGADPTRAVRFFFLENGCWSFQSMTILLMLTELDTSFPFFSDIVSIRLRYRAIVSVA